jgi:hypothetical protein
MKQQLAGNPLYEKLPGLSIEIILDSRRTCSNRNDEKSRTWLMTKESAALPDSTIFSRRMTMTTTCASTCFGD